MPTEQSQASRPFPPPWTQVPGTGRAGLERKAWALRPCFQASPLPRTRQGSGTALGPAGLPQGKITYSFNHHFPTACCVPGLEPEVKDTETGRAVLAWGLHGDTQYAGTRQRGAEYWVYMSTEEVGWGKSATDLQTYFPSGSIES